MQSPQRVAVLKPIVKVGLLLCETHSTAVVEYALQNIAKPIGVSTYRVTRELPALMREELPSVDDLQEVVTKLDATGLDMEQAKAFARAASVALKEK